MVDTWWTKEDVAQIRKKAYEYFLKGGILWWHPKRRMGAPLGVVTKKEDQSKLMSEFHARP